MSRQKFLKRLLSRNVLAVAAAFVAFGCRHLLAMHLGYDLPTYITFYPLVMAVGVLAGFWAGLLTTVISALLVSLWVLPAAGWRIERTSDAVGLALFCFASLFMSLVAEGYRRSRGRAAAYEKELALRQGEEQLRKLNRTLTALNKTNQALLRATDEPELLDAACKIITEDCGHAMVWIGYAEHDRDQTVRPMSYAGFEEHYLEGLHITWADTPRGRGPTGTAIRTRQPSMCADVRNDPRLQPWREDALRRGYASSLALPVTSGGETLGAITIYDRHPAAFSDDEIELLAELARNLAYGISALRVRAAHEKAEEALRESEQRVRAKLDSILSPEGDTADLELADIVDTRALQMLMEEFHKFAQLPMAIIDMTGKVLVGVGWQEICTRFHRVCAESCRHCVESDVELSAGVPPGEFRLYHCKNHMWDVATPIVIGGRHVGNVFTGQFFFEGETPDREIFRAQARHFGFDETDYLAALDQVPHLSRERLSAAMAYLMKLADMISRLSYSNIRLARSLTERERLVSSLRASEEQLRVAAMAAEIGIWSWIPGTRDVVVSANWRRLFGVAPDATVTFDDWRKAVHPEDRERAVRELNDASEQRREFNCEYRIVRPDGTVRWLVDRGRGSYDTQGRAVGMAGINLDITELKAAQEALIRSEKLASVGRMAATIAHEINNPLAAVMNTVYIARNGAETPELVREYLAIAEEELGRIAHLTRQSLGFYRESSAPGPLKLGAVLDSALELMKAKIAAKDARIDKECDDRLLVAGVPGELRQVFTNLLANSLDAVNVGGAIKLRVSGLGRNGRRAVRVTFADNGSGIEAGALRRLFEPFFTTKDTAGTGLGLWVSKQIIDKHRGSIRVHSRTAGPWRGTTFCLILPAAVAQAPRPRHAVAGA